MSGRKRPHAKPHPKPHALPARGLRLRRPKPRLKRKGRRPKRGKTTKAAKTVWTTTTDTGFDPMPPHLMPVTLSSWAAICFKWMFIDILGRDQKSEGGLKILS
ncbi:hypothetical protein B0H13DRAFT_1906405 [Mycena leptocephala]|nr:hypothetical protein B0H13DRAFT_1906405 [Mycena leptocephala]